MTTKLTDFNDIVRKRRTIKPEKYTSEPVSEGIINEILENARWAPTHGMNQPWRFKVFVGEGRKLLAKFQSEAYKEMNSPEDFNQKKFDKLQDRPMSASVVIAICMKGGLSEKIPEIEDVSAVACAVQNMYLTAATHGLGALWTTGGLTYTKEMKTFLKLGNKDKCMGFFYIGHIPHGLSEGSRNPIEEFVEWIKD